MGNHEENVVRCKGLETVTFIGYLMTLQNSNLFRHHNRIVMVFF